MSEQPTGGSCSDASFWHRFKRSPSITATSPRIFLNWITFAYSHSNPHHPAVFVFDRAVLQADQSLAHFLRHLADAAGADGELAVG